MTTFENLQELIDLLDEAPGITELTVHGADGAQVTVRRSASPPGYVGGALAPTAHAAMSGHDPSLSQSQVVSIEEAELDSAGSESLKAVAINANRVGIFHAAKQPLSRGERVISGQIVGYIESMKLMNEILADHEGDVVDLMVNEGTPVEYGQPLFRLAPAS